MKEKDYDYIIVGSGLFGATFAYLAQKKNKKCLIIEKRDHVGGNIYCENKNGIIVHKYGAHIFHTSDKEIWDFVNSFVTFAPYTHCPIANYNGILYNLPFNMNTFCKLWKDVRTPKEAINKIQLQSRNIKNVTNLEEQAIKMVGIDIYKTLVKGYTEKQWGKKCSELPDFIIKRLPLRFTFDNNYFSDNYCGIPIGGYNTIIQKMLSNCDIILNTDFNSYKDYYYAKGRKILYTGTIDSFFNFKYGQLQYRSLVFHEHLLPINNFQGCSVMNFTDANTPYTRIIEHKHFDKYCKNDKETIITQEYSTPYNKQNEPYYPINSQENEDLYQKYLNMAKQMYGEKIIFGGRLGHYKYYDMDKTIRNAINTFDTIEND